MFDTSLFLSLPIDIRQLVYEQLEDVIQTIRPPVKSEIFGPLPHYTTIDYDESVKKKYLHYIGIYDYIPNFIEHWCHDFEVLKYDSVTLDRLKLSIQYDEARFCMEWILVNDQLELGIFTADEQFLQLSYSARDYFELIHPDQLNDVCDLKFGINVSELNCVTRLCKKIQSEWLLDTVSFVSFVNCWDLDSPNVSGIISSMEMFSNVRMLKVESQTMFEKLINFHGVRENPGRTITYNVRQHITELRLFNIREMGYKTIIDLSKWEQLVILDVNGCDLIDLNKFLMPKTCKRLRFQNVKYLIWWDQSEAGNLINIEWIKEGRLDKSKIHEQEEDLWAKVYSKAISSFGSINYLELKNIRRIKGILILPNRLISEERIKILGKTKTDAVIII